MRSIAILALVLSSFTACDKKDSVPLRKGDTVTIKEDGYLIVPFIPESPSQGCYGLRGASLTVVTTFPESGGVECLYTPPKEVREFYPVHPANTNPCRKGITVSLRATDLKKIGNYIAK